MSNVSNPNGAKAHAHLTGGVIRASEGYTIADAYNTSIYSGDWVKLLNDGTIARAAAGDTVIGVFDGCNYQDTTGKTFYRQYWPASTSTLNAVGATALVYDDPYIVWVMQHNGTPTSTQVRNLYDIVATAGSTSTGQSAEQIDTSTHATSGKIFRQIGWLRDPANDTASANAKGLFVAIGHRYLSTSGI